MGLSAVKMLRDLRRRRRAQSRAACGDGEHARRSVSTYAQVVSGRYNDD